jgi:hypothetical protein
VYRLRLLTLAATFSATIALAAGCGGGGGKANTAPPTSPLSTSAATTPATPTGAPLPLRQRLVPKGAVPGYIPAPPVVVVRGWGAFLRGAKGVIVVNPKTAAVRLAPLKSVFVRAAGERLSGPRGNGGFSGVAQFRTPPDANRALSKLYLEGFAPCPHRCDVVAKPLAVTGIPGAKGYTRTGTATGGIGKFAFRVVLFPDGPFVYALAVGGTPTQPPASAIVAGAQKLHAKVKGRPPA